MASEKEQYIYLYDWNQQMWKKLSIKNVLKYPCPEIIQVSA